MPIDLLDDLNNPGQPRDLLADVVANKTKGGFAPAAKQIAGMTVKGIGKAASDFLPGVDTNNIISRYGQKVVDANPTAIHSFSDIADRPGTAATEAVGNAAGGIGMMAGAKLLGKGLQLIPHPVAKAVGYGIDVAGPYVAAALPSYSGIRERQEQEAPDKASSAGAKALAVGGAGAVGAIEQFGPTGWALKAMSKEGRAQLAKMLASKTITGSVAKGAFRGSSTEGLEEIAQNPIEQLAAYQDPRTPENIKDTLFGGAMGAIGGGVLGGGFGAAGGGYNSLAGRQQPTPDHQQSTPTPVTTQATAQDMADMGYIPPEGGYTPEQVDAFNAEQSRTKAAMQRDLDIERAMSGIGADQPNAGPIAKAAGVALTIGASQPEQIIGTGFTPEEVAAFRKEQADNQQRMKVDAEINSTMERTEKLMSLADRARNLGLEDHAAKLEKLAESAPPKNEDLRFLESVIIHREQKAGINAQQPTEPLPVQQAQQPIEEQNSGLPMQAMRDGIEAGPAAVEPGGAQAQARPTGDVQANLTKPSGNQVEIPVERYQWMRNKEGGQEYGNQQVIKPLTEALFNEHMAGKVRPELSTFDAYSAAYPGSHISMVSKDSGSTWELDNVGSLEELRPNPPNKAWVKRVDDFNSPDSIKHGGTADSEIQPATTLETPADQQSANTSEGGFDSKAWNKVRDDRIAESRKAGNTHLDKVPAYVETMRGKKIYNVHDQKETGVITTVDNRGNVYVNWSDAYSGEKNLATAKEVKLGKKAVLMRETSLGKSDLKDYVMGLPKEAKAQTTQPAPLPTETSAPAPVIEAPAAQPGVAAATILNKGKPFKTEAAAKLRLKANKLDKTHKVVTVEGGWGLQEKPPRAPRKPLAPVSVDTHKHTLLQAIAIKGVDASDPLANDLRKSLGLSDGKNIQVHVPGRPPMWLFRKGGMRLDTIAGDLSQSGEKYLDAHDRQEMLDKLYDDPGFMTPEGNAAKAQREYETTQAEQQATNKEKFESTIAAQDIEDATIDAELEWILANGRVMSEEEADAFSSEYAANMENEHDQQRAAEAAASNDSGGIEAVRPAGDQEAGGEAFSLAGETEAEIAADAAKPAPAPSAEKAGVDERIVSQLEALSEFVNNDISRYLDEFNKMMDSESNDGVRPPRATDDNAESLLAEMEASHPREALYLMALQQKDGGGWADNAGKRESADNAMRLLKDGYEISQAEAALRETNDDRQRARDNNERNLLLASMKESGEWEIGELPEWNSPEYKAMNESGFKSYRMGKDGKPEENRLTGYVFARRISPDQIAQNSQQSAIESIKQSDDIPTDDKIRLAAELRNGGVTADDVAAIVGDVSTNPEKSNTSEEPVQKAAESGQVADRIHTLAAQSDLFNRINEGDVTADEFKASFDSLLKNKEGITAELNGMTKAGIFSKFPGLEYRYKSEVKSRAVDAAYRDMISDFTLGESYSYGMSSGSMVDSVRTMVEKTTDEMLAAYADAIKQKRAEREARNQEALAGMDNPQTLEDYQRIMSAKAEEIGKGATFAQARMAMTLEQRVKYDELVAEHNRGERAKKKVTQQEQSIRAPGEAVETTEIIKTKHTKHGHDLWQFQMVQRVAPEEFKSLVAQAKRLGGDYSKYRGNGAIPGWQFRTEEAAKAFKALVAGDTAQAKDVMSARRDAFADDRSQSAVERLNEMADALEEKADASLGQDRKANTARRARFAASAEAAANNDKAMAQTMRNIAQGIEKGTAKFLDRVRQKVQVEMLSGFVRTAQDDMHRKLYETYAEQEKHKGEKPTPEVADYATFPNYTAYRSDLASLGRALLETEGTKKLGQRLMKVADDVSDAYLKFAKENWHKAATFNTKDGKIAMFLSKPAAEEAIARSGYKGTAIVMPLKRGQNIIILSPSEAIKRGVWEGDNDKRITLSGDFGVELVEAIGKASRRGAKVSVPWQFENAYDKRKRLAAIGIETPAELRAALREFIGLKEAPKEADKIKEMERAMIGRRNDGLDFFPTPSATADEMIETADIKEGMSVLEPSAGMGHIAERIREAGVDPDVVELSNERKELLEEKGFNVVGRDFMDTEGSYDRIIMNPPFSDGRAAQHVQHAYDLLKPGGRLVALVDEGVFFRGDKKAQAFRDWLEQVGATDEKLEEGTFNDPSLPVNTGVNARMLVITKETDQGTALLSRNKQSAYYSQLARAIESAPDKIFTSGNQIRLWLAGNAPKLGIKADELQWTGLTDWLTLRGKEKTSKAEVAEYLAASGVQIQEVELGDDMHPINHVGVRQIESGKYEVFFVDTDKVYGEYSDVRDARAGRERAAKTLMGETKFAQYVPPGGRPGTYRELLLTLPEKSSASAERAEYERWARKYNGNPNSTAAEQEYERATGRVAPPPRTMTAMNADKASNFQSSHFDQPNILAHLRVDEVEGANGERLLRVIEVQSDWSAEGRKKGFKPDRSAAEIDAELFNEPEGTPRAQELINELGLANNGTPSAPFVQKTEAYVALAIKKAISHAANNGFDGIVFATGQQNADLYDLSKQVDRITYYPGTAQLFAGKGRETVIKRRVAKADLPDVIGKEIADRLVSSEVKYYGENNEKYHELTGVDLKVGGEGMRKFYDEIIPSVAVKVLRQIGADAKVASVALEGGKQPGFMLTDAIRDKAEQGLPLFAKQTTATGLPKSTVESIIKPIIAKWKHGSINAVQSVSDLPPGLQREIYSAGAEGDAEGVYYGDGVVYLMADHLPSESKVMAVLKHEAIGHLAAEELTDQADYQRAINSVKTLERLGNKTIKALAATVDERQPGLNKDDRAREVMALAVENGSYKSIPILQKAVTAITSWVKSRLRAMGFDFKWVNSMSEGEIFAMLREGERRLEVGKQGSKQGGKQIALASMASPSAFKKWFGNSKVVDADGKPLVVYHGTKNEIDKFDRRKSRTNKAFFFSTDPAFASSPAYTGYVGGREKGGGNVMPVYLHISKPLVLDDLTYNPMDESAVIERARNDGYDGINVKKDGRWIAFNPTQIKSAIGNNGNFDGSKSNILLSRSGNNASWDDLLAKFGKPQSESSSKYAELNQAIREENATTLDKGRKWLKKTLAPGGLLPEVVFKQKIKRDSEFGAIEFDVAHLVGKLERAIKAHYNLSADKIDEKTQRLLSDVMAGKVGPDVPQSVKIPLLGMRQYIDGMTVEYLNVLEQQRQDLIQEAERTGSAEALAEANERASLMETISKNVGQYVHRSYRAFDDKAWPSKVPDSVLDGAREYLLGRYRETGIENQDRRAEVVLNEILKHGTAYESMEGFIKESKLGAKDLSVLKKREDIAPEIRALLGEYTDPRINFAKSATKMGRLIWNQRFLDRVRELGMGEFLFNDDNKPPEATVKMAGEKSDVYAPLNGLWATPEVAQAFKDALGKEQMANWYRTIVQWNGAIKYGKTVLSPTTAARNWMSAFFFTVANGHFDMKHMAKSIDGIKEYFGHGGDGAKLAYLRELKQLGVVYDTPYAGEMMRLLEDSQLADTLIHNKGRMPLKTALDYATKMYQYGDDFWKIIGYENEKQMFREAGYSEQEAKEKAAERIRDTYPTYSMVGQGIQSLRRFPLVGSFVSFPAEIIRTSINMVKYLAEDYKDPKMRPRAMKRAAGLAIASSFAYALQAVSMAMLGYDDDDEEAIRLMAPQWSKNSNLLFTGRDEKGNIRFIDLSFLDPYNYWKRPIVAVTRGQPWTDAIKDVAKETLTPFFGVDIAAGAIFDVMANKKGTGGQVYKPHDDVLNQLVDIEEHLRKNLQPGLFNNMGRTYDAINGEVSKSGKTADLSDEAFAWFGWRMSTLDPKVALYYKSRDFIDAKSEAGKNVTELLGKPNDVSKGELHDAYDLAVTLRQSTYEDMHKLISAAKESGMTNAQIRQVLKSSGISGQDSLALIYGRTPRYQVTPQTINNIVQKNRSTFGPESVKKVRERQRELTSYSSQG